ncbi:hypothetical protein [Sphingomonas sp. ID0503]|uniref:hypothetical protein n=1 Tax=Sphingomonas sp. ID0503 TaxID=3399691 RepID=UPI003AFA2B8F
MRTVEILQSTVDDWPVFHGRYNGAPVTIRLDRTAYIKLGGDWSPNMAAVKDAQVLKRVEECAGRIIAANRTGTAPGDIVITALDLD